MAIYDSGHSYPLPWVTAFSEDPVAQAAHPPTPHPSGQEPALPRSLCNLRHYLLHTLKAKSPSFPGTPHPKQEHCLSLSSCKFPKASPKVWSCLGTELFWNSPRSWGRRSSSVRQEKLVPWSSLRANTVAVTSATGIPPAGCWLSNFSPWSSITERCVRGAPPSTWQWRVRFSPTGCHWGRGASSTRSGNPGGEERKECPVSWTGYSPAGGTGVPHLAGEPHTPTPPNIPQGCLIPSHLSHTGMLRTSGESGEKSPSGCERAKTFFY